MQISIPVLNRHEPKANCVLPKIGVYECSVALSSPSANIAACPATRSNTRAILIESSCNLEIFYEGVNSVNFKVW